MIRKYKACFCIRGDHQKKGIDFFDTYAPVVSWPVIRLMLTLSIICNLKTRQVDYSNAFAQAEVDDDIYVNLPADFDAQKDGDFILKLNKSLYGLHQSPLAWLDKLSAGLKARGFVTSEIDPCLFIALNIICIIYVDDCLFFAKEDTVIDQMIDNLHQDFELQPETDVTAFLGIQLVRNENTHTITLTQPRLIHRILETCDMIDCHSKTMPTTRIPLGSNDNGPIRKENWSYSSVMGMLLYLASNTCPDLAFAVNQAA